MELLRKTLDSIEPVSAQWQGKARERMEQLALPHWSLGRLMDMAIELAGMSRSINPKLEKRAVITCAGDHGVVAEGVSAFPQEVTPQMVENFVKGGAAINALSAGAGAEVYVGDLGVAADLSHLKGKIFDKKVAWGTKNIAKEAAMTTDQAIKSIEGGIEIALEVDADLYATGEMGIGNTTPSAAICAVMTGLSPREVTGRGTGINDDSFQRKVRAIESAIEINRPNKEDGLDVLSKVGGFEIGGMAGVVLAAASLQRPVIIDGFISTAAALIACSLKPECAQYIFASHKSVEIGHIKMLELMGKEPLIDLGLRLGEGTGAAVCINIVDSARRVLSEILTFEEVGLSTPTQSK